MEYIKKLLVIYLITTLCVNDTRSHGQSNELLTFKKHHHDDSICVCFLKSPSSTVLVPDKLHKPGHDSVELERLVVYFYRNPKTKELKMYTPNAEKQRIFPDLYLEPGDTLETTPKKTLDKIFDKNPKVIKLKDVKHPTGYNAILNDLRPVKPNSVDIEHINNKLVLYDIPKDPNHLPGQQHPGHNHPSNGHVEHEFDQDDTYLPDDSQEPSNHPNHHHHHHQHHHHPNNLNIEFDDDDVINDLDSKPLSSQKPESMIYLDIPSPKYVNNGFNLASKLINSKFPSLSHENSVYTSELQWLHSQNHLPNSQVSLPDILFPPPNSKYSTVGNKHLTFDQWFNNQMLNVYSSKSITYDSIDIQLLKVRIRETLTHNGLYLSENGLLKDSNGKVLNMADLRLRPILIGESVGYDYLRKSSNQKRFRFPPNLPYLQSILITLVYPPKILGIIPLGKVTLPEEVGVDHLQLGGLASNMLGKSQHSNIIHGSMIKWSGKEYPSFAHYKKNINSEEILPALLSKELKVGSRKIILDKLHKKKVGVGGKQNRTEEAAVKGIKEKSRRTNVIESLGRSSEENHLDEVSVQNKPEFLNNVSKRLTLDKLVQKITSLLGIGQGEVKETASTEKSRRTNDEDIDQYEPDEEEIPEESLEEVEPGFRIIGGSAAIGSGSPISSRGRSGDIV